MPTQDAIAMSEIESYYAAATGRWTGCHWPTDHGPSDLNLDEVTPAQAREQAAKSRSLADDWESAAEWLEQCAADAAEAEQYAAEAIQAARRGDFESAMDLANKAVRVETEYGDSPTWGTFASALQDIVDD